MNEYADVIVSQRRNQEDPKWISERNPINGNHKNHKISLLISDN